MPLNTPNESLFDDTRMSFGEHLEELRKVLVRALLGAAVGIAIGLIFADRIVLFLQLPLTRAITDFSIRQATEKLKSNNGGAIPPELLPLLNQRTMVPRRVLIDPGQLVSALRAISPTALQDVEISPYRFRTSDFDPDQLAAIAEQLVDPKHEDPAVLARLNFLKQALSTEARSELQAMAARESPAADDQQRLTDLLNQLVETESLIDSPEFAELFTASANSGFNWFTPRVANPLAEMKERFASDPALKADGLRRLNRLLIWSTLSEFMAEPQLAFAELDVWEPMTATSQSLSAPEGFMIWMKAGIIVGLFVASPWIFYQIWTFVAAGLYPHEQRYIYIYLPVSLALFFAGAGLAFFFVFDPVLGFLFQFNARMGIDIQPRIGDWLSFALLLPLGFGIAFQLPIAMLFLHWMGLFTVQNYLEKWRVAILVIFFIAMLLTPAEPTSMILMAIPLTLLYFFGIALCRWMPHRRSPYREATEPI